MKNATRRAAPIATQPARQIARKNYIPKQRMCFRLETVPRCVLGFTDAFHRPQICSKTLADILTVNFLLNASHRDVKFNQKIPKNVFNR